MKITSTEQYKYQLQSSISHFVKSIETFKMTIAFYKFRCVLEENGDIFCKYDIDIDNFTYEEILGALEDLPLQIQFPFHFIFCDISYLPETWIQLFILRNASLYEIVRNEVFMILVPTTTSYSEEN